MFKFNTILPYVNDKVESGELNKDSMVNEAQGLYKNMGSNPLFQAMDQMHGQGRQQQQQQQQPKPSNKTQARLQKKLREKQKIQVNKVDE